MLEVQVHTLVRLTHHSWRSRFTLELMENLLRLLLTQKSDMQSSMQVAGRLEDVFFSQYNGGEERGTNKGIGNMHEGARGRPHY